ncbi:MAG TPA: ABC transporter permease [Acidimicrobiales bacterium]|nr:ABC transporter permease [Acidimicrobiales bacterium]
MTALPVPLPLSGESVSRRAYWALANTLVLTKRSMARIAREPEQLLDVTIQPVIFVLLFTYVFGSAIALPGGGSYHEYLIGGMFGMAMAGTAPGTAVGISTDMKSGLIDRFRALPISRAAVLAGRVISDLSTQVLGSAVLIVTGLCVGWGIHRGPVDAVAAIAITLFSAFAMTWAGACAGMMLTNPEAAQALGFIVFLPLSFVSNAFVPTQGMPGWLRAVANWNPLSAVAASCRNLFGNPNPAARVGAWPMQHPELAAVLWSVGLTVVFAPLAVLLYRRKAF